MDYLCLDIVNSNLTDWRSSAIKRDMLDDPQWLSQLFDKWDLGALLHLDSVTKERLTSLRKNMHETIVEINAGQSDQVKLREINNILQSVSMNVYLVYDEPEYQIEHDYNEAGWSLVIWRIAYSFAQLLTNKDKSRIKICDNHDCGWVFFRSKQKQSSTLV